eukprot:SAG31_NODE_41334_length_276_cov_1.169492_1_plen_59_part_01
MQTARRRIRDRVTDGHRISKDPIRATECLLLMPAAAVCTCWFRDFLITAVAWHPDPRAG